MIAVWPHLNGRPPANEGYVRQALGRYLLERNVMLCWFHDTLQGSREMIGGGMACSILRPVDPFFDDQIQTFK